jgi:hypothetical protein
VPFYSGSTLLQNWNAQNRAKIVFDTFVVAAPVSDDGGSSVPGCKSVDSFTANAKPAFETDLGNGQQCVTCHGLANPKPGSMEDNAEATFDLRLLDADPASACREALGHVLLSNKDQSELLLTCENLPGGDSGHPVRGVCGTGPAPDPDAAAPPQCVPMAVIQGMQNWLNAE